MSDAFARWGGVSLVADPCFPLSPHPPLFVDGAARGSPFSDALDVRPAYLTNLGPLIHRWKTESRGPSTKISLKASSR